MINSPEHNRHKANYGDSNFPYIDMKQLDLVLGMPRTSASAESRLQGGPTRS